jgi:hypothetical protein
MPEVEEIGPTDVIVAEDTEPAPRPGRPRKTKS